jgi:mitochondrial import receptor subunit TOM40
MGQINSNGVFMGRCGLKFFDRLGTKITIQQPWNEGNSRYLGEIDYLGNDFIAGLKVENPNVLTGTGNVVLSYMQSLTKSLSGGIEWLYEKPFPTLAAASTNFGLRYAGNNFVVGAVLQHYSNLNLSYHQKISEKVSLCTDLALSSVAKDQIESVATVGALFAHRMALIRMSLSTKFVSAVTWDVQIGDGLIINFCGEIDHLNTTGKFGIGFQTEF